ncbi:MAG: hypothetical protein OHK0029_34880 [Armatimonadaceae bacterium]
MPTQIAANVEQDERVVEEVHCSECGLPIPTIPNWYATVNVKFTCDACRQKGPRLGTPLALDPEARASSEEDSDGPALDEEAEGEDDIDTEEIEDTDEVDDTDEV